MFFVIKTMVYPFYKPKDGLNFNGAHVHAPTAKCTKGCHDFPPCEYSLQRMQNKGLNRRNSRLLCKIVCKFGFHSLVCS